MPEGIIFFSTERTDVQKITVEKVKRFEREGVVRFNVGECHFNREYLVTTVTYLKQLKPGPGN